MATISFLTTRNQGSVLDVKFGFTPNVSTLSHENFELWTTGATPTQIADPFRGFDQYNDYNSVSRTITLFVEADLDSATEYELRASGLKNTIGAPQPADEAHFTTGSYVPPTEPVPDVVEIIDHSVKSSIISEPGDSVFEIIEGGGGGLFDIVDTDPENGSYYVASNENNGRVTIVFNEVPASIYINSTYFKVQRKAFGRGANPWETLPARIILHTSSKSVYIDFPSNDATPVYYEDDHAYFEANYKYRVRVSKNINN